METARRVSKLEDWGTRRVSRAHLLLARHPRLGVEARQAVAQVEAAWNQLLPVEVSIQARLLDTSVLPGRSLALQSAFAVLELSGVGGRAVLEIDLPLVASFLEVFSGESDVGNALVELTRAEQAALAYAVLRGIAALRGEPVGDRWSPRLVSVHTARRDALAQLSAEAHLGIDLTVTLGTARGGARLLLPARAVQAVVAREDDPPSLEAAPEVLAARLNFVPRLARTLLSQAEVDALQGGDVVLLEGAHWQDGCLAGSMGLRGRKFELEGSLTPDGFVFEVSRLKGEEEHMEQHGNEATLIQHPTRFPVEVEVELARLPLSLGALGELRPGAILPLRVRSGDPVLLRLGDRAVARAELVDLEGEVGARILALLADP